MVNLVQAWVRGDADWDSVSETFRQWSPALAGAIFGAGWWCFIDALVTTKTVAHESVPFTFWLPGVVATVALILMNLVPRESLHSCDYYGDEDSETKARCWLFMSYIVSFGAVAGAGAVFIQAVQHQDHVPLGVGSLLQAGFTLLSALLLWAFRTPNESSGYTIY